MNVAGQLLPHLGLQLLVMEFLDVLLFKISGEHIISLSPGAVVLGSMPFALVFEEISRRGK